MLSGEKVGTTGGWTGDLPSGDGGAGMTGVNCIATGIYDAVECAFGTATGAWYSL